MSVEKRVFGKLPTGEEVTLYRLQNRSGAYADVMDLGAVLVNLCVPDAKGELRDVNLGYDTLEPYLTNGTFFGAVIGRSGNRIAGGRFSINGITYQMPINENENNLHSGPDFYHTKLWETAEVSEEENSVMFSRISPDGEQGFPGTFNVHVTYTFTESNALKITYDGVSDRDTVANLTNHSYFNLKGAGCGTILDHKLQIAAENYTPVADSASIPTGEIAPVAGTPFDFRQEKTIGDEIDADFDQLNFTGGYDHNFVTDGYKPGMVRRIATARSEESGIIMDVYSDLPDVQFYAGNFIKDHTGKGGKTYRKRSGFCLETQFAPNAVNQAGFHSPILKSTELYRTETIYAFRK